MRFYHLTRWVLPNVKNANDNNHSLFSAIVDVVLFHESAATIGEEVVSCLTEMGILGKQPECIS